MSSGGFVLGCLVLFEVVVDGSGDVAFEDADGFFLRFASVGGVGDKGFGWLVVGELGDGYSVNDRVEVAVSSGVESHSGVVT